MGAEKKWKSAQLLTLILGDLFIYERICILGRFFLLLASMAIALNGNADRWRLRIKLGSFSVKQKKIWTMWLIVDRRSIVMVG
jgi:hypothetical protein